MSKLCPFIEQGLCEEKHCELWHEGSGQCTIKVQTDLLVEISEKLSKLRPEK